MDTQQISTDGLMAFFAMKTSTTVPSTRIRQYLTKIRQTGSIPELRRYRNERFERCRRLRSVRGLGPSKIALTVSSRSLTDEWFSQAAITLSLHRDRISELYRANNSGPWQTAHVVPPLLRFLRRIETAIDRSLEWQVSGISDPFEAVTGAVTIIATADWSTFASALDRALRRDKFFQRDA